MALIKCPDCGREVSDRAPTCPNCGAPIASTEAAPVLPTLPSTKPRASHAKFIFTWLFITVVLGIAMVSCMESQRKSATDDATAAQAEADKAASCERDLQCAGDKHMIDASVACKGPVERQATHDVKWSSSDYEPIVTRFRWSSGSPGNITYIGDKAAFQNGFGAYTPVTYSCEFEPSTKKVVNVTLVEGRLPDAP